MKNHSLSRRLIFRILLMLSLLPVSLSVTKIARDDCGKSGYFSTSTSECGKSNQDAGLQANAAPPTTPFTGTISGTINKGQRISSTFHYPRERQYFSYHNQERIYANLNYSGSDASIRIFYSNYFSDSDYLVSYPHILDAKDCYLFETNADYIIELSPYSIGSPTNYSLCLNKLSTESLTNHQKYVMHQTFDSSSNLGYHYEVLYFDVSEDSSTGTNSSIKNYGTAQYLDALSSNTYFYSPSEYSIEDNRRLVVDTGYDEYNAIAYGRNTAVYNSANDGYQNGYFRFSGTFVSETAVVSCAHSMYPSKSETISGSTRTVSTGMNKELYFYPGRNDYSGHSYDYYGLYKTVDVYSSVSYVLQFSDKDHSTSACANYDWSICLTEPQSIGSREHSYMGISNFSSSASYPFARCAGYPALVKTSSTSYNYSLWATVPEENDVAIVGNHISSSDIVISGGNSGGPLYLKTTAVQNGQVVKRAVLLGIVSSVYIPLASPTTGKQNFGLSYFCRSTSLIVNIYKEIIS